MTQNSIRFVAKHYSTDKSDLIAIRNFRQSLQERYTWEQKEAKRMAKKKLVLQNLDATWDYVSTFSTAAKENRAERQASDVAYIEKMYTDNNENPD